MCGRPPDYFFGRGTRARSNGAGKNLAAVAAADEIRATPMPPAARLTDFHQCPMVTPGVPPIPHVGGPVTGPGMPTVLIGNLPAARVGDMLVCVGPPDTIIKGSATVMIGGFPAARVGDTTAHGGTILMGAPTVMIGG